ncbi:hypothetical protein SRIMM317S_02771 [Streptomyces rimosus subsp. rimosus]
MTPYPFTVATAEPSGVAVRTSYAAPPACESTMASIWAGMLRSKATTGARASTTTW